MIFRTLCGAVLLFVPLLGVWFALTDSVARLRRRETLALALVAWGLYAVLVVELLSLGAGHDLTAGAKGNLSTANLLIAWLPAAVLGGALALRHRTVAVELVGDARRLWATSDAWLRAGVVACAAIAALVGLVALVSAPNNWDSMTYHLMRVEQWVRLGGVAHYATHYEPQLYQPPGAELLILHGRVLTGGDSLAAVPQWLAFVTAMPLAGLAAARLGAGRAGQVLAALLVATMPMALMQGSSTQNDLLLGMWLLIAAALALGIDSQAGQVWPRALGASGALALAVLTKGTGLIYGAPVAALLAWAVVRRVGWRQAGWRRVASLAVTALMIVVLVNAGQWARNHQTFGKYVASGGGGNVYKNEPIGPAAVVSNLARNASNHLDVPIGAVNRVTTDAIADGLGLLGIDASDPATTFGGQQFKVGPFGPHEDHAGNLFHLILAVWAVVGVFTVATWRTRRRVAWALMLVTQLLLFAALLKWQNWHARLHLPIFLLAAPLVAACLADLRRRAIARTIAVGLLLVAPLYVFYNYTRPLVGERSVLATSRESQYFLPRPNVEAAYRALTDEIERRAVKRLAVVAPIDQWEYPIYALARRDDLVVYDALANNPSARYPAPLARADAVACINCDPGHRAMLEAAGFSEISIPSGAIRDDPHLAEVPATINLWLPGR